MWIKVGHSMSNLYPHFTRREHIYNHTTFEKKHYPVFILAIDESLSNLNTISNIPFYYPTWPCFVKCLVASSFLGWDKNMLSVNSAPSQMLTFTYMSLLAL